LRHLDHAALMDAVGGDPAAFILLRCVIGLVDATSFEEGGVRWHAKTRDELRACCHLSEWRYRRALALLVDRGLVEVRHGPHPYQPGLLKVARFALTGRTDRLLGTNLRFPDLPTGREDVLSTGRETILPTDIIHTEKITREHRGSNVVQLKVVQGRTGMLMSAVAKQIEREQEEAALEEVTDPSSFARVWNVLMSRAYPSHHPTAWGSAAKGRARAVMKLLGEDTTAVLRRVIPEWERFNDFCRSKTSSKWMERPDVGFLQLNAGLALEYASTREAEGRGAKTEHSLDDL
jgi:hypothetical protein